MDDGVVKKARSWLVGLHPCALTEAECASYVWPAYVKYAKWSLDGTNTFRAYVECLATRHVLKLPGLDGARVFSDPSITRDLRRAYVVQNLDGECTSWEFGAWGRNKHDHTKRPPPALKVGEEDTAEVKSLREEVDRLKATLTNTLAACMTRIAELEARPAGVIVNNIVINNFGNEDVSHISDETRKHRFLAMGHGVIATTHERCNA